MCIIVSKEKGVDLPTKEILEQCFNHNSDGAGLMYAENGKVNIVKGFMDFKSFYEYLMKLDRVYDLKEKALVMHFRISTGGNIDGGNCHPYPISKRKKDLRSKCIKTELGMAHNGVISMYSSYSVKEELNDTQRFIQNAVAPIYNVDKEFYKDYDIMSLLEDIAGSKLCFLDKNENIYYVGKFVEDNGIMYSNTSYIPYKTYPVYNYDDMYDGYEDDCYYDPNKSFHQETLDFDEFEKITEKRTFGQEQPLTEAEFNYFLEFLSFQEVGTEIESAFGEKFTIDAPNTYAFDPYFNLHLVDWDNHDIFEIYEDCVVTKFGYCTSLNNKGSKIA